MPQSEPNFRELMEAAQHSAVHLEMRDIYGVGDEAADFTHWQSTGLRDSDPGSAYWTPWVDLISRAIKRGVTVRRARVVSEPVTEYIRYEHAGDISQRARRGEGSMATSTPGRGATAAG